MTADPIGLSKRRLSGQEAIGQAMLLSDRLGRRLDPEMIRPVAAMICLGIKTTQSCSGHLDSGTSFPWIDIQAGLAKRRALSGQLPAFHLVKRGSQSFPDNYRLQPRQVAAINSADPGGRWSEHLNELADFSERVLSNRHLNE